MKPPNFRGRRLKLKLARLSQVQPEKPARRPLQIGNVEMTESKQTIMDKAEARFVEKQKKAADRNQATNEYMSEAKARAIKTARLRQLRLAKEDADRAAGILKPVKARVQRAPRSIRGKTSSSRVLLRSGRS